jgi:hypothetical protein
VTAADQHGQATFVGIGICFGAIALGAIVLAVGSAYLAQTRVQQAADIAATSLARPVGDNPIAHAEALAERNGAAKVRVDRRSGGEIVVHVSAPAPKMLGIPVGATVRASAIVPDEVGTALTGTPAALGSMYAGPLVTVDSAQLCPRVAADYRAMQRAAGVHGIRLHAVSGYRTVAEQAALFAQLGPTLAARPGTSLHHAATELDITVGPAGSATHSWLSDNAARYNFIQRYSWEPWHWGNVRGC